MAIAHPTVMTAQRNSLRIIGGKWRGRRIEFPSVAALRPTPDRVRETLFNWLQTEIVGARCLDLFAGSGALGLEALSRGAAHVVFVDSEQSVSRYLHEAFEKLDVTNAEIHVGNALRIAIDPVQPFDVVFLDPPYRQDILTSAAARLESQNWLAPNSLIYLESPAHQSLPQLPGNWRVIKSKSAGQVGYHLARRDSPKPSLGQ
jgi:16S rRNA (guanine966-N2)-methyltransferase